MRRVRDGALGALMPRVPLRSLGALCGEALFYYQRRAAKPWPVVAPNRLTGPAGLYPDGIIKIPPFGASWIEAPPFDAAPVSEIHSAAEGLFCTRYPFAGTAPPNRVCAEPPAASVPLPSLAELPAVLTSGSGFCGPTGAAMPCALVEAVACAGARLPAPSVTVGSDCTLVLAAFTRSVIGLPFCSPVEAVRRKLFTTEARRMRGG